MTHADVVIIGAGASGLLAACEAAGRGRSVVVLDHADSFGRKLAVTGGGRCNFTNRRVGPEDYVCGNPHFVKSALARFTPQDFLARMDRWGLPFVEEGRGQLFCAASAADVGRALFRDAVEAGAAFRFGAAVSEAVRADDGRFLVRTSAGDVSCAALVVASGGLAWPQVGATNLGFRLAKGFGLRVTPVRPGLVPLLAPPELLPLCRALAGVVLSVRIAPPCPAEGPLLFTHRGISGPAVLDASLRFVRGVALSIDLAPGLDLAGHLAAHGKLELKNALAMLLPKNLAAALCEAEGWTGQAARMSKKALAAVEDRLHAWPFAAPDTEGFAKAEVSVGGVDVAGISSKTMEAKAAPGLFFTGEVLDVTGRLGGFNLHWAWASGFAAGRAV